MSPPPIPNVPRSYGSAKTKAWIATLVVFIWVALLWAASDTSLLFYFAFASVLVLLSGVFAALVAIGMRKWQPMLNWAALAVVVFSCLRTSGYFLEREKESAMASAQPLIAAVDRFYAVNHRYPASIEEIIPTYLPAEPRARIQGRDEPFRLFHSSDSTAECWISFQLPLRVDATYFFKTHSWRTHEY